MCDSPHERFYSTAYRVDAIIMGAEQLALDIRRFLEEMEKDLEKHPELAASANLGYGFLNPVINTHGSIAEYLEQAADRAKNIRAKCEEWQARHGRSR